MLSRRDTCNYVFKNSWLNSDFQETKTRTVESTPPVSKPVPRISEGCSSRGRNPQHQQCPQTHAAEDTGHLFHLSLSCLKPLSGSAPPAQTIVFLQTDLAVHVLMGAKARSKQCFSLGCAFWETQICPIQHLSPSLAAVMCPRKWTEPSL